MLHECFELQFCRSSWRDKNVEITLDRKTSGLLTHDEINCHPSNLVFMSWVHHASQWNEKSSLISHMSRLIKPFLLTHIWNVVLSEIFKYLYVNIGENRNCFYATAGICRCRFFRDTFEHINSAGLTEIRSTRVLRLDPSTYSRVQFYFWVFFVRLLINVSY